MTITPKFDNLSASINRALAAVDTTRGTTALGRGLSSGISRGLGGLAGAGSLVGAFSTITSKAMDVVSSHVGSAVSRLDTLKNYPVVMGNLGVRSDEASASIQTMSDRLSSLPTSLSDMATTVQGLYTATQNYGMSLTDVTKAGLGLNDMLLAGGQSQAVVTAAMEQFRQMVSKGKPDMQDWRSLVTAAPAQMDQLAKAMLGPTANANQLYYALGGGNEREAAKQGFDWATISMDQMLAKISELDTEGADGITSFREQAETAQGGIQTAFDNMGNAVTKGVANVLDAIGRDRIVSAIGDVKGGINEAFSGIAGAAAAAAPMLSEVWSDLKGNASELKGEFSSAAAAVARILPPFEEARGAAKGVLDAVVPLTPAIAAVAAASAGVRAGASAFGAVRSSISGVAGALEKAGDGLGKVGEVVFDGAGALGELGGVAEVAGTKIAGVGTAFGKAAAVLSGPWGIAIAAAAVGVALLVGKLLEAKQRNDAFNESMSGISDAVSKAEGLRDYRGTVEGVGDVAGTAALSIDDLVESINGHEQAISASLDSAQQQVAVLDTAQGVIESLAGKTDLTTQEQGRLKWALDEVNTQLGLNISATDVMSGSYEDADGNVRNLTESLGALIEKKKEEARQSALSSALTDAYKAQYEAAGTLADAQARYNEELDRQAQKFQEQGYSYDEAREMAGAYMATQKDMADTATNDLAKAQEAYDATTAQVDSLTTALGDSAQAAGSAGAAYAGIGSGMQLLEATLMRQGQSLGGFRQGLQDVGADTGKLADMSEEDLTRLVQGWDGSTADLTARLLEMGVGMSSTALSAGQLADSVGQMLGGLSGDQVGGALDSVGISMEDFKQKCDEAGLSSADFSSITQEQFAAMVGQCGGDVDTLIAEIQGYNDVPVVDKDGNVTVDQAQLYDAQGNVYVWNGTELVNKDTGVACDSQDLVDGQGHVWTWNSSDLKLQDTSATVQDRGVTDAQGHLWTWNGSNLVTQEGDGTIETNLPSALGWMRDWNNGSLVDHVASATVNIIQHVFGGGDGNARGGVVRGHATGAVFTAPTWISATDYIGEDGPEYYDGTHIVPLTSKHGQPFANLIADGVARRGGLASSPELREAVSLLRALLDGQNRGAVYLDGDALVGELASRVSDGGRMWAR